MQNIRPLVLLIVIVGILLTISGCGPVYRTQYSYAAPSEMAGKQCIAQCANTRELCRSSAENRAAQERASCQQYATLRYAACLATAKTPADRNGCSSSAYCNVEPDTEHCELDYNRCYRDCGGIVESRQVCVSGC